jgi:excisionase family DNA binding protein
MVENSKGEYLNYQELSEWLNLPMATVYTLVHRKTIPFYRLGGRLVRFKITEVESWLNKCSANKKNNEKKSTYSK